MTAGWFKVTLPAVPAPERRGPVLLPAPRTGWGQESEITDEWEGAGWELGELRFCPKLKMNLRFLEIKEYILQNQTHIGIWKAFPVEPSSKIQTPSRIYKAMHDPSPGSPSQAFSPILVWVLDPGSFSVLGFVLPFSLPPACPSWLLLKKKKVYRIEV